jgi:hypothetical protein
MALPILLSVKNKNRTNVRISEKAIRHLLEIDPENQGILSI